MANMYFSKEHVWLKVEGETAVVGITEYAQKTLGTISFVDLPKIGKSVKADDSLLVVESVKAASDVYAPVAGTVSEVNRQLDKAPELINKSALSDGWICKLHPFDAATGGKLLTADQYKAFLAES